MDFQNRVGARFGGGGIADASLANQERKERLRRLALETIDLSKDPYFMKNHVGTFECRLCLTIHPTEGSYLAHTQGKKHSTNLARRAAKEQKDQAQSKGVAPIIPPQVQQVAQTQPMMMGSNLPIRKVQMKIGRPGYKVTKVRDPETLQPGLYFQIYYPDIVAGTKPHYRFMSAYEQRVEPPSKFYQYLLFAGEPYETIAFKVQSRPIDRAEGRLWQYFDQDMGVYHMMMLFA